MSARRKGGTRGRRILAVSIALVALILIGVGGTLLPVQQATYRASPLPVVGRTSWTCTPAVAAGATAELAAAAIVVAPGREGSITAGQVGAGKLTLPLTKQGTATVVPGPARPVIISGQGVMATAASAMMFSRARSGSLTGLMAAPCAAPNTEHWFVGVGATADHRTELVLTNPDDGQAEVDLRFYGRNGLVVVPGSPGLVIEGRSSRSVSLESLIQVEGPLTVAVRASTGRVSAMALDRRSAGPEPRGAEWQPSSVTPAPTVIIPGVPEGTGPRELVVVNPGGERAEVSVELLGIEGAFAPTGAEQLVVPPESTATVSLAAGLAGQTAGVRLTSTRPVTGAVQAVSAEPGAVPDLAFSPAVPAINRAGVVPLATVDDVDTEFTLSNAGSAQVDVDFEVFDHAGRSLRRDDITVVPGGTATRRLTSSSSTFLVVRAPLGSAVYGSISYAGSTGAAGGLATMPMISSDQAGQAPQVRFDPGLGR